MKLKILMVLAFVGATAFAQRSAQSVRLDTVRALNMPLPATNQLPLGWPRDSVRSLQDTVTVHRTQINSHTSSIDSLRGREVNMLDFGALGDNSDNTSEFKAARTFAASAGVKTIRINAGTYLLSDTLRLSSGIDWRSSGGSAIIKLADGTNGSMFVLENVTDVTIEGLTFDWNYNNQTLWDTWAQGAVVVDSSSNITLDGCTIKNSVFGVFGHADTNLTITRCMFTGMGTGGAVALYSQVGVDISFNRADNTGFAALGTYNAQPCLRLFETNGGSITYNKIWLNRTADNVGADEIGGIAVFPPSTVESSELLIVGNEIHGRGNELSVGITVVGYSGLNAGLIAHNIIDSVGTIAGIELANRCNNISVVFNHIRNSATVGIAINAASDTSYGLNVSGNQIVNCLGSGISVQGNVEYSTFAYNHFQNLIKPAFGSLGISFNGKIKYVSVSYNTIRGLSGAAFSVTGAITNSSFSHNIVDSVLAFGYMANPLTGVLTVSHNILTRPLFTNDAYPSSAYLMFNTGFPSVTATTVGIDSTTGLSVNRGITSTETATVGKIKINSVGSLIDSAKVESDTLRFYIGGEQYIAIQR